MLVYEIGDGAVDELKRFCAEHDVRGGHFVAIGAFQEVTLRYFDWSEKRYLDLPLPEQVEVCTLAGNVSREDDEVKVHAHLVVARADGTTRGGHLKEGRVRPTLELTLTEAPAGLRRAKDEETGLSLLAV